MASICCGGGGGGGGACAVRCDRRTVTVRSSCVVPVINRRSWANIGKLSMTVADMEPVKLERKRGGAVVSREKVEEWLRASVVEIVKNLRESPLLVHLYAEANGGLSTTAAANPEAEDWKEMVGRWGRGEDRTPEGVIFVEKLKDDEVGIEMITMGVGKVRVLGDSGAGKRNGLWTGLLPVENDPGRVGYGYGLHAFLFGEGEEF